MTTILMKIKCEPKNKKGPNDLIGPLGQTSIYVLHRFHTQTNF